MHNMLEWLLRKPEQPPKEFSKKHLRTVAAGLVEQYFPDDGNFLDILLKGRFWKGMSTHLRSCYPHPQRAKFLDSFFGKEGANFPNGVDLASFFNDLLDLGNHFLSPSQKLSEQYLQDEVVAPYLSGYDLSGYEFGPVPVMVIKEMKTAQKIAQDCTFRSFRQGIRYPLIRNVAWLAGRSDAKDVAGEAGLETALHIITSTRTIEPESALITVVHMGLAASWIVVQDLMMSEGVYTKGNRFSPLLHHGLRNGYWPIGLTVQQRKTVFAVYEPTIKQAA